MHKKRLCYCISILVFVLIKLVGAEIKLQVFSKNEEAYETNIVKPRFYVQNVGDEPISDFYCYYYFTTEENKTPILDSYYTPDASASLENIDSSNYRIRFDFSGTMINPGEFKPNPDGKVFGIHYDDWSVWDKTNDFSNTDSETFTLNSNIPVYSSLGTLIYGNTPDGLSQSDFRQSIQKTTNAHDYAVLSKVKTDIRDMVNIKGGSIGSGAYVEVGANAVVNGSVYCNGKVFLRSNDTIKGDVYSVDSVNMQNNVIVMGQVIYPKQLEIPQMLTKTVTIGSDDRIVNNHEITELNPGVYKDFKANANSTVTLFPGDYFFDKFILEPEVKIVLKVNNADRLNINVKTTLSIGDRTKMSFEQGETFPYSINFYSAQTEQVFIGNDCEIYGNIVCPDAEVVVNSRTYVNGTLYGRIVRIEPDAILCKPPVLQDFWHSEWACSPSFSSSILDYMVVVPDVTSTLIIYPVASSESTVLIDGYSSDTIPLLNATTDITLKVNTPDQCGSTVYNVNVKKTSNYQIFVNDNSPCFDGKEDGLSWATAFKNLQDGIDKATIDGKEIWVAEGTYKPSKRTNESDPRSATFLLKPGIEIKGGFDGTETDDEPVGSIYNTVLSGDILGNDNGISSWPPVVADTAFTNDNVYHVVTIDGNECASGIRITSLTVKGGVANGSGENSIGGGIFVKNVSPVLDWCCIMENHADSSGAGIYDNGNIKIIKNCLFKKNVSRRGNGGGLYACGKDPLNIDASVFDGNSVMDTLMVSGGGAFFVKEKTVHVVNSVMCRNRVNGKGGAIINENGTLDIINCTIANNSAVKGTGGIQNIDASTSILNTILWNSNGELADSGFTVTYSCINGGYAGDGNISEDPAFVNIANPEGDNGEFGDNDDGLRLTGSSLCIDAVTSVNAPEIDMLLKIRPVGAGTDIGAYEYVDVDKCNKLFFGKFKNGVFYENYDLDRIGRILHPVEIFQLSRSRYARVIRGYVENNKYTRKQNEVKVYIKPVNADGSDAKTEIEVKLYKIAEENGLLVFQSLKPDYVGKKVLFTEEQGWHGCNNDWAYVIYIGDNPEIHFRVPHSQFK